MLRLYDAKTQTVRDVTTARPGVVRVACDGELRSLLVADLIRRVAGHHGLRTIGIWTAQAPDLNVRPAELSEGEADLHVGETVGYCELPSRDGMDPLAVRLALLTRHYRSDASLTSEDLATADRELTDWRRQVARWAESPGKALSQEYVADAVAFLDDDLDSPKIFKVFSRLADDASVSPGAKFETMIKLDMILGLDLVALVGRI